MTLESAWPQSSLDYCITDFTSLKNQLISKMVGSNGTMIAIRLVRSKLRKREEHSNSVHPVTDVVLQTATTTTTQVQSVNNNQPSPVPHVLHSDLTYRGQFLWTQPPPPAQQYLYNHNQVSWVYKWSFSRLVQNFELFKLEIRFERNDYSKFTTKVSIIHLCPSKHNFLMTKLSIIIFKKLYG